MLESKISGNKQNFGFGTQPEPPTAPSSLAFSGPIWASINPSHSGLTLNLIGVKFARSQPKEDGPEPAVRHRKLLQIG